MPRDTDASRPASRATLEILGPAGEPVVIRAQGSDGLQSRQIFQGVMPQGCALRLRIPISTLFVVVAVGEHSARIDFQDGQSFQQLDLRPPHKLPAS